MLVPGFVVGYAACQSRILGAVWFIGFVVLGFISGISVWWMVTAVLLILSYIFCISENVGDYDDLDTYDKLCVLIPAFGAMRFIDRFGLEGFFGVIGKILSVIAIILNFALMIALWIVPKNEASAFGTVIMQIKDFGAPCSALLLFSFSCRCFRFTAQSIPLLSRDLPRCLPHFRWL